MSLSNVILLQKMMVLGYKATKIFLKLLLEREWCAMDPMLSAWNGKRDSFSPFYLGGNYVRKEGLKTWLNT